LLITYQIPHPFNPTHVIIKSEEIDGLTFLKRHCSAGQFQRCNEIFETLFPPLNLSSNGGNNRDNPPPPHNCRRKRKRKRRNKKPVVESRIQLN